MVTSNTIKDSMKIPPLDLTREYDEIKSSVQARIERVLASGRVVLGKEVEEFEERFARFSGAKFAIGVASGTDALLLPLMQLGIKPGDEIITTAWTFVATVGVILRLGAVPRFVDIEYASFNMNPVLLEKAFTSKTKAIIPVHIYGHPVHMKPVTDFAEKHGLPIVEDCAQAHGARSGNKPVGLFGGFGAFSFYPTKNLGAYGDAGAVITNDRASAEKIKQLRIHGANQNYVYDDSFGINSRLDEIQAAILNVKLDHLDSWNKARKLAAAYYTEHLSKLNLSGVVLPSVRVDEDHVFHLYTLRVKERDKLLNFLHDKGISAGVYYPIPVHQQKAFRKLGFGEISLPETERASREVLSLPLFPQITREEQDYVIRAVGEYFKK